MVRNSFISSAFCCGLGKVQCAANSSRQVSQTHETQIQELKPGGRVVSRLSDCIMARDPDPICLLSNMARCASLRP